MTASRHSRADTSITAPAAAGVLRCAEVDPTPLLARYGLHLDWIEPGADIPGSFWGDEEAGLIGNRVLVRPDTPIHSVLHESCHYVCMDAERRGGLHTDAGGGYLEEAGVCYLQVLLADHLPGVGRVRLMAVMDRWGYSFRLASTAAWFESDAGDARAWLREHGLIDERDQVSWRLRR